MKRNLPLSVKILSLSILSSLALSGCQNLSGGAQTVPTAQTQNPPAPTSQAPIVLGDGVRASYADVVERVAPAVVNIEARHRNRPSQQQQQRGGLDEMLPDFFGQNGRGAQPPVSRGVGSGVIVNSNGTILTNNHVVEEADEITVELTDKRNFKAKVIGTDPASDLAVLKIDAENLPSMNLGDSEKVRVGDVVLAIGNPLGIGQTVTFGIISAKGRRTGIGTGSFEDFLQTDAPINRGNSGGALVNLTGELIGINSQILSPGGAAGGNIGIGFAIPSNMARGVMDQLVKNGRVTRGQLGVIIRDVDADLAASLNLKETRGAAIQDIAPGKAGEKAGLKRYDVIIALNGERIDDGNALRNRIAATPPGNEVTLTIVREGKEQQIKATLNELSEQDAKNQLQQDQPNNAPENKSSEDGKLGLGLTPLTPELSGKLQVQSDKGLVVTEVDPEGPAADVGIREQDVILEVNRQPVGSFEEIQSALSKSGDRPVLLLISRRGQTVFLTIQPRK